MSTVLTTPASMRVSYQGAPGAFGEHAITSRWPDAAIAVPARTFDEALILLRDGAADRAVLPVANSVIGRIVEAQAAVARHAAQLEVEDEIVVPVRHALLALPGSTVPALRTVGSHPAALAQCARYLAAHPWLQPCSAYDTAGAAWELAGLAAGQDAAHDGDAARAPWYAGVPRTEHTALAVIASAGVAARCGLAVLADGIQDDADNATSFAVLRRREPGRW